MPGTSLRAVAVLTAAIQAGCAATPSFFAARKHQLRNDEVCMAWGDAAASRNQQFEYAVIEEARRRGLSQPQCAQIVEQGRQNGAAFVGALLAVGVGVAAARGGYGGNTFAPTVQDLEWDWDLINSPSGLATWVCRGVQTGQFADDHRCWNRLKSDARWPGLGDSFRR